jgi:hypothetical protein
MFIEQTNFSQPIFLEQVSQKYLKPTSQQSKLKAQMQNEYTTALFSLHTC